MPEQAFLDFLRSNYVHNQIKGRVASEYYDYTDDQLEEIARAAVLAADPLSMDALLGSMPTDKGLTKRILASPDRAMAAFGYAILPVNSLVPVFWVSDVPHRVTHGTLRTMADYWAEPGCQTASPKFFDRVSRIQRLPTISAMPVLAVRPARGQRAGRIPHPVDPDKPLPMCELVTYEEGEAYIEDGNHTAVARVVRDRANEIQVICFNDGR
ncbi:MAG: hypothetical protein JWO57_667 [Pseudonocardiales bacterium]|nr:hypothetical protein [Pseudonocardiales bacterium]